MDAGQKFAKSWKTILQYALGRPQSASRWQWYKVSEGYMGSRIHWPRNIQLAHGDGPVNRLDPEPAIDDEQLDRLVSALFG